jgi:hypothetical protein
MLASEENTASQSFRSFLNGVIAQAREDLKDRRIAPAQLRLVIEEAIDDLYRAGQRDNATLTRYARYKAFCASKAP